MPGLITILYYRQMYRMYCARNCPVSAISGKVKERHVIDTETCIKCGACMEACPVGAIIKSRRLIMANVTVTIDSRKVTVPSGTL